MGRSWSFDTHVHPAPSPLEKGRREMDLELGSHSFNSERAQNTAAGTIAQQLACDSGLQLDKVGSDPLFPYGEGLQP